ncbi:MAG: Mur ligase [Rhodocyclaceae bacterium]|nr:MAG: Mur ligase [Rhodocyclaceae bacterium]
MTSVEEPTSFEDSRRLTGPNLFFARPGAVLEALGVDCVRADLIGQWRIHARAMSAELGWPQVELRARAHAKGCSLALTAPVDQWFSATEVNEWAWQAARGEAELFAPGHALATDADSARHTLRLFARAERKPALMALLDAAHARDGPALLDDDLLTLGSGCAGRSWPLDALPAVEQVRWSDLHGIPTALVTGSNGKTTTVRLLAAMLRAHGLRTAFSCTDGVFRDGEMFDSGDYSGPAGARTVLRMDDAEAAVLETARGGILRRGLAVDHCDAAIVTNISVDHFGEYGIDDLDGLTQAKLVVAHAVCEGGALVLNADDAQLLAHAGALQCPLAWFALDHEHPRLVAARAQAQSTCAVHHGSLLLSHADASHDLGVVADMPLTLDGLARYNIANIAGASLLATVLGVPAQTIASVLAEFGRSHADNPGRLETWRVGGISVLMDYAHNPDGLQGLLDIAQALRGAGRLGLILGQAGNRGDAQIRELAAVAASVSPELIVLKDMEGYLRGREQNEVANLLRDELMARGMDADRLPMCSTDMEAARHALGWARAGDVLVLPIHAPRARAALRGCLDQLERDGWQAGGPLAMNPAHD